MKVINRQLKICLSNNSDKINHKIPTKYSDTSETSLLVKIIGYILLSFDTELT